MTCTRMCSFSLTVIAAATFVSTPLTTLAFADAKYTCTAPAFVAPPVLGSDDLYKATTFSDCTFTEAKVGGAQGISQLRDALLVFKGQATKVNEGPVSVVFEGLPADRFDVVEGPARTEIDATIHMIDIIASDEVSLLTYDSQSVDINGSGTAGYLRKTDARLDLKLSNIAGTYTSRVTATVHVKKPKLVPGGIFKSQAEKRVIDEFKTKVGKMAVMVAAQL